MATFHRGMPFWRNFFKKQNHILYSIIYSSPHANLTPKEKLFEIRRRGGCRKNEFYVKF